MVPRLPAIVALLVIASTVPHPAAARQIDSKPGPAVAPSEALPSATGGTAPSTNTPADYTIGPGDILSVVFWREKQLSGDVVVRPDGLITLPLINDVPAAGRTPDQLRQHVTELAERFVSDPTTSVVVREIHSRQVFITGQVEKPGSYPLLVPMSILQLIATAGGLREYADSNDIVVIRSAEGQKTSFRFNYKEVEKQRNLGQNIELRPGDTVVVP